MTSRSHVGVASQSDGSGALFCSQQLILIQQIYMSARHHASKKRSIEEVHKNNSIN